MDFALAANGAEMYGLKIIFNQTHTYADFQLGTKQFSMIMLQLWWYTNDWFVIVGVFKSIMIQHTKIILINESMHESWLWFMIKCATGAPSINYYWIPSVLLYHLPNPPILSLSPLSIHDHLSRHAHTRTTPQSRSIQQCNRPLRWWRLI